MLKIVTFSLAILLLSGCATKIVPETHGLVDVVEKRKIVLSEVLPVSRDCGYENSGLLPGTYVAEKENALGTFFRGPGKVFYMKGGGGRIYLYGGGLWLAREGTEAPTYVYSIYDPDFTSADSMEHAIAAVTKESSADLIGTAPVPLTAAAGVGTGIAMGIISALGESPRGHIDICRTKQEGAITKLRAAVISG
jgi:hypothetical protein